MNVRLGGCFGGFFCDAIRCARPDTHSFSSQNVVYKFITAEEEREQLIPVLGMLLHFSADEVKEATKNYMRIRAAQAQKNTDASGGESSWGVFPRWS